MTDTLDPAFLAALDALPAEAITRWCGDDATGAPPRCRLVAAFALPPARGQAAFCLFESADGVMVQLALRYRHEAATDGADVLHVVRDRDGVVRGRLESAWSDAALRGWLREALGAGASLRSGDWEWVSAPERAVASRSVGVESRPVPGRRHDVVLFGPEAVGIAYRRLTRGSSPELDLLRHLERVPGVRVAPILLGSAIIRSPDGERSASCVLETIADDAATVESVLVYRLRRALEGDPSLQAVALDDVRAVGVATRELHAALGRPFDRGVLAGAVPATPGDVEVWVARSWAALTAATQAAQRRFADVPALLNALQSLPGKLQQFGAAAEGAPGLIHRIHGSLRLNCVLISPPRLLSVVEFDGDPALPDRERTAAQSPWRDVARLLVSIAECAARAAVEAGGDDKALEIAWLWEREARKACLEGYGSGGGALHALLAIFELEYASRLLVGATDANPTDRLVAAHTLERLSRNVV